MGCGSAGLCGVVAIVDSGCRIFAMLGDDLWTLAMEGGGLTDAVVVFLLLSVNGRDIRRRLVARRFSYPGLLAVTYEVLEVLDGAHLSQVPRRGRRIEDGEQAKAREVESAKDDKLDRDDK